MDKMIRLFVGLTIVASAALAVIVTAQVSPVRPESGGGSGTVTSVAASMPTGLTVAGSPITSSGTLAVSLTSGYMIPGGGTSGHVLTSQGASAPIFAAPAASGNVTYASAYASPPGSPASGDMWYPTDSFYVSRYSGSTFAPWGPIFPMTPPVDGDFSWVNQLTATVVTTNGGIYLSKPGAAGTHNWSQRVKTAPATPYTITVGLIPGMAANDFIYAALIFRQSSDGKLVTYSVTSNTTGSYLFAQNWTNATTNSSNLIALNTELPTVAWLQISDDGANRIMRWSADGQNWQVIHTIGRTNFLTADQVGIAVNSNNATYPAAMTLLSWKEGS